MERVDMMTGYPSERRRIAPLTIVLGAVFVFFCAVLVFVFIATKRANPVMLDQKGNPVNRQAQPGDGGTH